MTHSWRADARAVVSAATTQPQGDDHGHRRQHRNGQTDPDRIRSQGPGRDRRLHRRPDADPLRVVARHQSTRATERRPDGHPLRRLDTGVALNIILIVAILGYFGVETTSFAALVAGLGIAVGAAWGGLLSNFAAGAFILVLRPFKVGDYVVAGEVEGTVQMIGLFNTTIDSPDNVQTFVGNAKIMGGTIKNFSDNPYRRVDLTAQLDHSVDPADAVGPAQGSAAEDRERRRGTRARRRDPDVQRARTRACGSTVLQHCALLAGLLRHQSHDSRDLRRRRLSRRRGAPTRSRRHPA